MHRICAFVYVFVFCGISSAFAEEMAHDAHHGGEAGGSGLPQLDPSNFTSQIFWLLVAFAFLYLFFSRKTLPEISSVIETRHEHIQKDLDTVEEHRKEAEEVREAYEAILADARKKASKSFSQVEDKIKTAAANEYQAFQQRSAAEIADREQAIEEAKKAAMSEMNVLAAEIAREAAEKIIGKSTDLARAKTVVKSLNSKAKAA